MRGLVMAAMAAVILLGGSATAAEATPARVTAASCAKAWYEWQYSGIAPGFPTTLTPGQRAKAMRECRTRKLLPGYETQATLTQKAINTTAQILEREIRRVSIEQQIPPCLAIEKVLKPVGPNGRPLGPRDDVEGYALDSFLPILKYNWQGGPFRLKFGVGCDGDPWANLWFFIDPYPPAGSHPERFPSDDYVKANPWNRTPVGGAMSTCMTWGPGLKNDGIGGEGFMFAFDWSHENLPLDVRSCYPKALGLDGLAKYPWKRVPVLR